MSINVNQPGSAGWSSIPDARHDDRAGNAQEKPPGASFPAPLASHSPNAISFGDDTGTNLPATTSASGASGEAPALGGVVEELMELIMKLFSLLGLTPPNGESGSDAGQSRRDDRADGSSSAERAGAERRANRDGGAESASGSSGGAGSAGAGGGSDSSGGVGASSAAGGPPVSGGAAGAINGDGIAGNVSQTPGGKQITDGPNEGQKLHRTGMSGYENVNGVESFSAQPGGELSGSSNTSRSEAYYSGDSTSGKSFAADYKVDVDGDTTIFQMKDNSGGAPEFRVSVGDDGDVVVNTRDGSPEKIGTIEPGQEFRLSVTDNPDGTTSFGLNDTSGASIGGATLTSNNPMDSTQFRYGTYTQGDNTTAHVMVSNVETDL